jgi:hypothetical protein
MEQFLLLIARIYEIYSSAFVRRRLEVGSGTIMARKLVGGGRKVWRR